MARLPSLIALRAFEAVARHGNMSRAAEELHVTHSAVSKQVHGLEEELGVLLIRRLPRAVEPTAEGARLAASLSAAFGLIESGIAQLQPGPIALSCSASIMMRWLIPRLPRFKLIAPQIDLRLSAGHGALNLSREGVDLAIRNDVIEPPEDVVVKQLMQETFGPVCSPEYANSLPLSGIEDLRRAQILATSSRPQAWSDWQSIVMRNEPSLQVQETYEHFYLVLQSAACGLGVALAPRFLVTDDLQAGRLVAPFGFVRGHRNVVLWVSQQARRRDDVKALAEWLQQEARETVMAWGE